MSPVIIVERDDEQILRIPCRNRDRKSTRLNSSHMSISYAVFCLKKIIDKQENRYEEKHGLCGFVGPYFGALLPKPGRPGDGKPTNLRQQFVGAGLGQRIGFRTVDYSTDVRRYLDQRQSGPPTWEHRNVQCERLGVGNVLSPRRSDPGFTNTASGRFPANQQRSFQTLGRRRDDHLLRPDIATLESRQRWLLDRSKIWRLLRLALGQFRCCWRRVYKCRCGLPRESLDRKRATTGMAHGLECVFQRLGYHYGVEFHRRARANNLESHDSW